MKYKPDDQKSKLQANVRKWYAEDLKTDNLLLNRLVELWVQLDDAEDQYDKPFGLRMPDKKGITDLFRKRLLNSSGYAIYDEEKVVGFCITKTAEYENSYFISALVIDRAYRGKNYGKSILDYVIQDKKGQNALLRVSTNNRAGIALYEKCGFVPMSQVMIRKAKS